MPHFPVVNNSKSSYKVRPVFNASSHVKGQLSLNDCVYDMPNLLPTPVETLLRFREFKYGIIGDIRKAYMMVGIHPEFRNHLCFLWFSDDQIKIPQTFRMTRNTFGVKDAQFNTIAVIREQAKAFRETKKSGYGALKMNTYMDDVASGGDSIEEALRVKTEVEEILADGGMLMHKWRLSGVAEQSGSSRQPIANPLSSEKVLGMSWDNGSDTLLFDPAALMDFVQQAKPCKRTILGAAARLHDPVGLISPFVMIVKLILQKTHINKLPYDKGLPQDLSAEWNKWCSNLTHLSDFAIPRSFAVSESERPEFHIFADASEAAYAAVIYLKVYDPAQNRVRISLVISKARLTPIKSLNSLTIPKKELLAALCAARLASLVDKTIKIRAKRFFWTDSMNVWYWIRGESPEKHGIFLRNRLTEILTLSKSEEWGHCPGQMNPADIPSRGMLMDKLKSCELWFHGPPFLQGKIYPSVDQSNSTFSTLLLAAAVTTIEEPLIRVERYSTLSRATRVCAMVIRASNIFKSKIPRRRRRGDANQQETSVDIERVPLTPLELRLAKQRLIREAQIRCFREAMSSGEPAEDPKIGQFAPFVDDNGCLRVGGRLQNLSESYGVRHPMLLGSDHFTELVVQEIHSIHTGHLSVDCVLAQLRQEFWVIRARQVVHLPTMYKL